jgi:hypothetical protein
MDSLDSACVIMEVRFGQLVVSWALETGIARLKIAHSAQLAPNTQEAVLDSHDQKRKVKSSDR